MEHLEVVKVSFNLPSDELERVRSLAERRRITVTQTLRQAIASELFIQRLMDQGSKLLIEEPEGSVQQIVFSQAAELAAHT